MLQFEYEANKKLTSQFKGCQAEGILSDSRRVRLFVPLRLSGDWMSLIHIREGNLLNSDYQQRC